MSRRDIPVRMGTDPAVRAGEGVTPYRPTAVRAASGRIPAGGESFADLPASYPCTGRTGRRNREELMMIMGLAVVGALLVGACSLHLMRRYRGWR